MVKAAVLVKMSPDVAQLKINPDGTPKMEGLPWKVSDFDKHAVEAAVKLKEAGQVESVICYTYNPGPNGANLIKEPLAMGCDEGVVITGPPTDGGGTSKVLAKAIEADGGAELVFAATESLDRVAGEVGARVAALLGMAGIYNVQKIDGIDGGVLKGQRDSDPNETFEATLPVMCTMNDEINHPRLPALMQILQAGKKPIHQKTTDELGLSSDDLAVKMQMVSNIAPKQDRKNMVFQGDDAVAELVAALRKEGAL